MKRILLLSATLALLALPATSQTNSRTWLRVRAADLYGHTIQLGDFRRGTTALLSGADASSDGLWVRVPDGFDPASLRIEPPLANPPKVDSVTIPDQLSASWSIVSLPLGAWGITSRSRRNSASRRSSAGAAPLWPKFVTSAGSTNESRRVAGVCR